MDENGLRNYRDKVIVGMTEMLKGATAEDGEIGRRTVVLLHRTVKLLADVARGMVYAVDDPKSHIGKHAEAVLEAATSVSTDLECICMTVLGMYYFESLMLEPDQALCPGCNAMLRNLSGKSWPDFPGMCQKCGEFIWRNRGPGMRLAVMTDADLATLGQGQLEQMLKEQKELRERIKPEVLH